jgi:hypothetical protein
MSEPRFTTLPPFNIEEAAQLIGTYKWLEMRMFEVFGSAINVVKETHIKVTVGEQSHHHAWHAELWHKRLPELRELSGDQFTKPANVGVENLFEAISLSRDTLELFTGVFRVVVPRKIAAYTDHLARTSAITDGPTIRSLKLVLADELADWQAGEIHLQSLLRSADDVDRASAHQSRLEKLIVESGLVGMVSPLATNHSLSGDDS